MEIIFQFEQTEVSIVCSVHAKMRGGIRYMAKAMKEPEYIESKLKTAMINYRVYYMSISEKILYNLLLVICGGIVGIIFFGGLFKADGELTTATLINDVVVFAVAGIVTDRVFINQINDSLLKKRARKLQKEFIDLLYILATALSTGNTLQQSFEIAKKDLRNQYTEQDMIVNEVDEILKSVINGFTLEEALENFGKRSNDEDIENFVNVISTCKRLGGDFKTVVSRTKSLISDKIAIQNEITTKLTSNQLQMNAMCLMPILLVAMLKMGSPQFSKNLSTPIGVIATLLACILFIVSYFLGKKIVEVR